MFFPLHETLGENNYKLLRFTRYFKYILNNSMYIFKKNCFFDFYIQNNFLAYFLKIKYFCFI